MNHSQDSLFPTSPPQALNIAPLLVSLFLVLVVFFIILNSISRVDEQKNETVINSINYAFSEGKALPKTAKVLQETSIDLTINQFFNAIQQTTSASLVQLEELDIDRYENTMSITVATDKLFKDGDIKVRDEAIAFLNEIAASLSSWRPGIRVETEWLIGVDEPLFSGSTEMDKRAILRAGTLARALVSRGIDAKAVVAGLAADQPGETVIVFNVRLVDHAQLELNFPAPAAPAPTPVEAPAQQEQAP